MRTFFTLAVSFLFFSFYSGGQAPGIEWAKCYGGVDYDQAKQILHTPDGGYIIAGASASIDGDVTGNHGGTDYWIIKTDDIGNILWQKCLGGSQADDIQSIAATGEGGYILAGTSSSNDGDVSGHHGDSTSSDCWIVKIDSMGNIQWQKSLGGSHSEDAAGIIVCADGGYLLAATTGSNDGDVSGSHGGGDYWVVKLTHSGSVQWEKCFGGSKQDACTAVDATNDGGYVITGFTSSSNDDVTGYHPGTYALTDAWTVKLDSAGNMQWETCTGGSSSDEASCIKQTTGGGYIIGGSSNSSDADLSGTIDYGEFWMAKLDSMGVVQWSKRYGGDRVADIIEVPDGGYVAAGMASKNDSEVSGYHSAIVVSALKFDYWVVHIDDTGALQWQECLGGTANDESCSLLADDDGYSIAGATASDDGDVSGLHGWSDYWIVRLGGSSSGIAQVAEANNITISPNPTTSVIHVQAGQLAVCELADVTGKVVIPKTSKTTLDLSLLASGIYLLNVYDANGMKVRTEKVVKE